MLISRWQQAKARKSDKERRPRLIRRALFLERLEDRLAPATAITVIVGPPGSGSLDGFLSAVNGTLNPGDGGNNPGTLSTGALAGVGSGVNINIQAQNSIAFNDLGGTLSLQTGAANNARFAANSAAITFANVANTLKTQGASFTFFAGTNLTVSNLNTMGGDVTLFAGNGGAGNVQFESILTNNSGNLTLLAGSTITQPSGNASGVNLYLSAGTGIGTSALPLATTVSNVVAQNTTSGGIFISNTGALNIGFSGDLIQGVRDTGAATDPITLSSSGTINVTRQVVANEIISAPGNVSVTEKSRLWPPANPGRVTVATGVSVPSMVASFDRRNSTSKGPVAARPWFSTV